MQAVEIFTVFDDDCAQHVIMVRSHLRTEPFGPRIFRAPPHPAVRTRHDTAEGAAKDVAAIQAYFEELPKRRKAVYREQPPSWGGGNGLGGIEDCPLFFPT